MNLPVAARGHFMCFDSGRIPTVSVGGKDCHFEFDKAGCYYRNDLYAIVYQW